MTTTETYISNPEKDSTSTATKSIKSYTTVAKPAIGIVMKGAPLRIARILLRKHLYTLELATKMMQNPDTGYREIFTNFVIDVVAAQGFRAAIGVFPPTAIVLAGTFVNPDFYNKQMPQLILETMENPWNVSDDVLNDRLDGLFEIQSGEGSAWVGMKLGQGLDWIKQQINGTTNHTETNDRTINERDLGNYSKKNPSHEINYSKLNQSITDNLLIFNCLLEPQIKEGLFPLDSMAKTPEKASVKQSVKPSSQSEVKKKFITNQQQFNKNISDKVASDKIAAQLVTEINNEVEKITIASQLTQSVLDEVEKYKALGKTEVTIPDLLRGSDYIAQCLLQIHNNSSKAADFEANKKQLIRAAEGRFSQFGLTIDIQELYHTNNPKPAKLWALQDDVCRTIQDRFTPDNLILQLTSQKKLFAEAEHKLIALHDEINHLTNEKTKLNRLDDTLVERFNVIQSKIGGVKYDKILPNLGSVCRLASNLTASLPITSTLFSLASAALDFLGDKKNRKKQEKIDNYHNLSSDLMLQRDCLIAQSNYLNDSLVAVNTSLSRVEQTKADCSSAKDYRNQLANKQLEVNNELSRLTGEIEALKMQSAPLIQTQPGQQAIHDSYQRNDEKKNSPASLKAGNNLSDTTLKLNVGAFALTNLENSIKELISESQALDRIRDHENQLAVLKDFNDQQRDAFIESYLVDIEETEEEKNEPDLQKRKEIRLNKLFDRLEIHSKFEAEINRGLANYKAIFADDEVIKQISHGAGSTLHLFERYAVRANLKTAGWFLNKSANLIDAASVGYQLYRICDELHHSIEVYQKAQATTVSDKKPGLSLIAQMFINPVFAFTQMGDRLIQLCSSIFFGIELFPDQTLEKLNQISRQIHDNFTQLSQQINQGNRALSYELGSKSNQILQVINGVADETAQISDQQNQLLSEVHSSRQERFTADLRTQVEKVEAIACKTHLDEVQINRLKIILAHALSAAYSSQDAFLIDNYTSIDLINSILPVLRAEVAELRPFPRLVNYRLLYPIAEILINNAGKTIVDNPASCLLRQEVNIALINLNEFLLFLQQNPKWLHELNGAIRSQLTTMTEKIRMASTGKLKDQVTNEEWTQWQRTKGNYLEAKENLWHRQIARKDRTVLSDHFIYHARQYPTYKGSDGRFHSGFKPDIDSKSLFSYFNKKVSVNYNENILGASFANNWIIACLEAAIAPLYSKWTTPNTPSTNAVAIWFSPQLNSVDNIALKHPFNSLGDGLAFYDALLQENISASWLMKPIGQKFTNMDYFLTFLNDIQPSYFKENLDSSRLVYFNDQDKRRFGGLLLRNTEENLPPLLFPKELLDNVKARPELTLLFEAEQLGIAVPIMDYIFEQTIDKKEYFLSIRFSFILSNDNSEQKHGYIDIPIARFDYVSVHAMAAVSFEKTDYKFDLNVFHFLINAMYGGYLAGSGSYDLSRGNDLKHNKSLIFANSRYFCGLFILLQKNPAKMFYYETLTTYLASPDPSKELNNREARPKLLPAHVILNHQLRTVKKSLTKRMMKHGLHAEKEALKGHLKRVETLYHVMVHTFKLYTNLDYHSIVLLLGKYLEIPHPELSKQLLDTDIDTFQSLHNTYLEQEQDEGIDRLHQDVKNMASDVMRHGIRQYQSLNNPEHQSVQNNEFVELDFQPDTSDEMSKKQVVKSIELLKSCGNLTFLAQENAPSRSLAQHFVYDYTNHFGCEKSPYLFYQGTPNSYYSLQQFCVLVDYLRMQFSHYELLQQKEYSAGIYPDIQNGVTLALPQFFCLSNLQQVMQRVVGYSSWVGANRAFMYPFTNGVRWYLLVFQIINSNEIKVVWQDTSGKVMPVALVETLTNHLNSITENRALRLIFDTQTTPIKQERQPADNAAIIIQCMQDTLIACRGRNAFTSIKCSVSHEKEDYVHVLQCIRNLHKEYVFLQRNYLSVGENVWLIHNAFKEKWFNNSSRRQTIFNVFSINELDDLLQQIETKRIESDDYFAPVAASEINQALEQMQNKPVRPSPDKISSHPGFFSAPKLKPVVRTKELVTEKVRLVNSHRLLTQLAQRFSLVHLSVPPDGSCQFHALAEQLNQIAKLAGQVNPYDSSKLRTKAVASIRANKSSEANQFYNGQGHPQQFDSIEQYLEEMSKSSMFGDMLTLLALAEYLGKNILILRPKLDAEYTKAEDLLECNIIQGSTTEFDIAETLIIYFNGGAHYDTFVARPNPVFLDFLIEHEKLKDVDQDSTFAGAFRA